MHDLKAALLPDMSELSKDFPVAGFEHLVAALVRGVVEAQKESLFRAGIPLRMRLEPPPDEAHPRGKPVLPTRLVLRDGDLHFRLAISCHTTSVMIGDTLVMTTSGNPAEKIATAIAKEVAKKLGLAREREAAVDAERTRLLGYE
jgi:hypothetical protein